MADNKGLSPEELKELQELEELDQLEALEKSGQLEKAEGVSAPQSALLGAQEGLTFGAASKLAGVAGALGGKFGGDVRPISEIYQEAQSEDKALREAAKEQNPASYIAGQLGGGVLMPVPGGAALKGLGAVEKTAAQGLIGGGLEAAGRTESLSELPGNVIKGAAVGGLAGGAVGRLGQLASRITEGARKGAGQLAVKATGATASQAEKFAPEAGKELLDRGIVSFGSTPEKIAQKAAGQMDEANAILDKSLSALTEKGAVVPKDQIISKLQQEAAALSQNPSKADVVRKLKTIMEDVAAGPDQIPLQLAEETKRGFQALSNFADPTGTMATKAAGRTYREGVEEAALAADPSIQQQFLQAKESYGLLAPIQEAAQKRALQQQQAPVGGLLDVGAVGVGLATGNPLAALISPAIRSQITKRAPSAAAVTLNLIPRTVDGIKAALPAIAQKSPQMALELESILKLPRENAAKALGQLVSQFPNEVEPSEYPSEFEGKLHSDEDRAAYKTKLDQELPPRERAKALSALNKDGTIAQRAPQVPVEPVTEQAPPKRVPSLSEMANRASTIKKREF